MDDPAAPPAPVAHPVPAAPPAAVPVATPAEPQCPSQRSGLKSTEAWLSLAVVLLGALPSTGLIANMPKMVQIIGLIGSVLTAMMYTMQRTHLKATIATDMPVPNSNATRITAGASVALLAALGITTGVTGTGDAPVQGNGSGSAPVVITPAGELACGKIDLMSRAPGSDRSLLDSVAFDIVGPDYERATAARIAILGNETVGCAVLSIKAVVTAGKTSGSPALSPIEARADALIRKYGWNGTTPAIPTVP